MTADRAQNIPEKDLRQVEISILIPCFQEEKNIQELVRRICTVMNASKLKWEVLLIDDGSTDQTWAEIARASEKNPGIKGIQHESNHGIVSAWVTGTEAASGKWIMTMDADLQNAPEEVPLFVQRMTGGDYDIVQGVRSRRLEKSKYRNFASIILSKFLKNIFRLPFDDVKSGFVLYKTEVFQAILGKRRSFRLFQHWMMIAAHSMRFKITQVPTTFYPRNAGQSFIRSPLSFALKVIRELPKAYAEFGPRS